jgi:hypothetical protein
MLPWEHNTPAARLRLAALLQPFKLLCHDIVSLFDAASHYILTSLTSGVTLSCVLHKSDPAAAGVTVLQASTAATWLQSETVNPSLDDPIHQATGYIQLQAALHPSR